MMQPTLTTTLQAGVAYTKSWPMVQELNSIFPENRVIKITLLAQKILPAVSVLSVTVQLQYFGATYLWPAIASALFILMLPFHGWYWLGHRALSPLPPGLSHWYQEIASKMQQNGVDVPLPEANLKFADLAVLLKLALNQLDRAFLRQMF